jgi:ribonuclease BN (tRNA processing enzyme)
MGGASGGTPGEGRSRRRESSLLVRSGETCLLVDASRDLDTQLAGIPRPDAVILTHGHRDASGGIPALGRLHGGDVPIPVHGHAKTHQALRGRRGVRLEGVELLDVAVGEPRCIGPLQVTAIEVPHARSPRFPTFAWRLDATGHAVVYASDVAELTTELEDLSAGAELLILDGAMYGRSIFTHLRIEHALPAVCEWAVGHILLTQIGRSAPTHEELHRIVQGLCSRAAPAFDGLQLDLDDPEWNPTSP